MTHIYETTNAMVTAQPFHQHQHWQRKHQMTVGLSTGRSGPECCLQHPKFMKICHFLANTKNLAPFIRKCVYNCSAMHKKQKLMDFWNLDKLFGGYAPPTAQHDTAFLDQDLPMSIR